MRLGVWTVLALGCGWLSKEPDPESLPATFATPAAGQEVAVLAGGCFWCLEADLDKLPGVITTTSGYAGGDSMAPTYQQVGAGGSGHREVVRVVFRTDQLSYTELLDYFWRHVDPVDGGGQFCDRGDQYLTAIYPVNATQLQAATTSRSAAEAVLGREFVTEIVPGATFWPAERYHQDYHSRNPARYQAYRLSCGRDRRIAELWGAH